VLAAAKILQDSFQNLAY